jgi:hypothetical protein
MASNARIAAARVTIGCIAQRQSIGRRTICAKLSFHPVNTKITADYKCNSRGDTDRASDTEFGHPLEARTVEREIEIDAVLLRLVLRSQVK